MTSILALAQNTAREILRDRILYGLLVLAVLMIGSSILLGNLSFSEHARIVTNLGLVAGQLGCAMIAVFIGSSLVWREIEKQTVLTLLSKPVTRAQFLLGKYLGLAFVITVVNIVVALIVTFVCTRYGVIHVKPFALSQLGILFESWILLSMAIFFGTFCRPTLTTIFTFSFWLVGHGLSDLKFFSSKSDSAFSRALGEIISRLLPNLETFNLREAAVYGDPVALNQIFTMVLTFVLWFILFLITSTWIFNKRDFT